MTAEEFVTHAAAVRTGLTAGLRAVLPEACRVVNRFMLSGIQTDEDWIAGLRHPDTGLIRLLIILEVESGVGLLGQTAGARQFNPQLRFNLELYHGYVMGTDAENSEETFLADAHRVTYGLGKNRVLAGQSVINDGSLRLGIRPSSVQALHFGKGQVTVDLRDIRYQ